MKLFFKTQKQLIPIATLAIIASIVSVFFLDQKICQFIADPSRKDDLYSNFRTLTDIGLAEPYFLAGLIGLIAARFFLKKESRLKTKLYEFSVSLLASLIACGIVTHLFKFIIGRGRPHLTEDYSATLFEPFNYHWHFHSMPSGHSQVMFTAATVLSTQIPQLKIFWFSFAAIICFSRIATLNHFLSDTILGAFIGYSISLFTLYKLEQRRLIKGS